MIPELTSWQCNWKGNQKGKGTDETPLSHLMHADLSVAIFSMVDLWMHNCTTDTVLTFFNKY